MKHLISSISKAGILIFSGLLLFGLTGCDFSGFNQAVDNFGVVIELDSIHTSSTVLVKDAKSNKLITEQVNVTFGGPEGDQVIDIYSDPLTERTIKSGILNFGISNSVKPTEDSPAEVSMLFSAEGFTPTSRKIAIDHEGDNRFEVELIRRNDPPSGVEMESNTEGQADQDGSVQQSYKVEVTSDAPSNSSASTQANDVPYGFEMEIPKGTVFKDREGNPLTGQLNTDLTYYNPVDKNAMKSIPINMETPDGTRLLTYGMVGLEITDSKGKVAVIATSEAPKITIKNGSSMPEVQGNSRNAMTCVDRNFSIPCKEAKAMVPVPENDDNKNSKVTKPGVTVSWVSQLEESVGVSRANNSNISFSALKDSKGPPLTGFAHRQPVPSSNFPDLIAAKKVDRTGIVEIKRPDDESVAEQRANISLFQGGYYRRLKMKLPKNSKSVTKKLDGLPTGEVNVTITFPQIQEKIKKVHNFHKDGELEVTMPEPPSNLIRATVEVTLACENPDQKVAVTDIPNASVLYRKANAESGADWRSAKNLEWDYDKENQELTGGSFEAPGVEQGVVYTFKLSYETETFTRDITIDAENVTYEETVSGSVCS